MQNAKMRIWPLSICLLVLASVAAADEPLSPAAYLKILADSKLQYNMVNEPARNPVEPQTCPRRNESMRVVQRGTHKELVAWPVKLEILKLLAEGEKHYRAENYDQAVVKYKAALAQDPEAAPGYLFYGDALLIGANDPAAALAQYQKVVALDPTLPAAHFFSSTAYVQLGRKAEAREEVIRALTYYPAYEAVWKIARQNPEWWGIRPVTRHPFDPPRGHLGGKGPNGVDIFGGTNGAWLGYALCKAVWANEARFSKQHADGGWSIEEERACVLNQLFGTYNATKTKLEKQAKAGGRTAPVREDDVLAALPPLEAHLFDAAQAHLLDGYILFEIIGKNCPLYLSVMNDDARQVVEAYIRKYLIVPANG